MPDHPTADRGAFARAAALARRAGRLPSASWRALARVLPLLLAVRVALWVLPYRTVNRLFDVSAYDGVAPTVSSQEATALLRTVAWAGRHLLADRPCLTQALACRWLLARRGYPTDLRLGVRKAEDGAGIEAHAWLEAGGAVILGGGDSADAYTPFRPARPAPRGVAEPS